MLEREAAPQQRARVVGHAAHPVLERLALLVLRAVLVAARGGGLLLGVLLRVERLLHLALRRLVRGLLVLRVGGLRGGGDLLGFLLGVLLFVAALRALLLRLFLRLLLRILLLLLLRVLL